jgi:triosephosphate isomerase (TIM)
VASEAMIHDHAGVRTAPPASGRLLVVGNWKMHGTAAALAEIAAIDAASAAAPHCEAVLCVPATLIARAAAQVRGIAIGAQDCHFARSGAHTGDLSAEMLADAGASWVILGHSERRRAATLSDRDVALRMAAAAPVLRPILCVGETVRDGADWFAGVREQLLASLPDDPVGGFALAYEPVWAIGSGRTPTLAEIGDALARLRETLAERLGGAGSAVPLLYGGSVNAGNAREICALPEVGGLLIGGASLTAASMQAILGAADAARRR